MSGIWALIPVKSLQQGKSRLSPRLSPVERQELSLAMLRDVLTAVTQAPSIVGGLVIHSDPSIESLATEMLVEARLESPEARDLNGALRQGLEIISSMDADGALIIPGDVPLVDAAAIEQVVWLSPQSPGITICPSLDEDGTNGLLLRPVQAIGPKFGHQSFHRHAELARAAGLPVAVIRIAALGVDIDEPRDLDAFLAVDTFTHAGAVLRGLVSR
jgi:2-phospho-L-lactate guanylyltransferase